MMCFRFEKSLYDLIRGMRHQKGNEEAYIQASLKECRKEIKGQDMGKDFNLKIQKEKSI
jgi:AP-3 complex subunit delta